MPVFKIEKTKDYTVMSNKHFREKELSLKAKGLLSLMLSLPDNWDYSLAGLVAICKENETAVRGALNELSRFGYVRVDKLFPGKTDTGRIEYVYNIFENPEKQDGEKQDLEILDVEILDVENPVQLNTKQLNTKKGNTKNNKKGKILKKVFDKCLEYDITDEVAELLEEFFKGLLDNKKLVTDSKIESTLSKLAKETKDIQMRAIKLSLEKGYMNVDPEWIKDNRATDNKTWAKESTQTINRNEQQKKKY